MNRLNRVIASIVFVLGVFFVYPVFAQISLVKTITPNSSKTTGTSIALTVPASGVAAGNTIIVSLAMDPATGTVSCTDTASNIYALDRDHINGSGTSGARTVILSAHNVTALVSGNTITCTHPSVGARALSASEFSGLAVSGTKDQTAGNQGQSTTPSSGNTGITTQATELLIGAIGVEGPSGDTFTAGASYTTIGRGGTTGGNAATNITINPEYRIVTATGTYAATGTLSNSRKWAAGIVTYKAKPPPVIDTVTPNSAPTGTPVTIAGSGFGTTQGSSIVTFNGVTATPTSWSASSITVPVPTNASTGPVVVTVSGVASNGVTFTLTYSPRVNAGGSTSYTDGSGNYWAADRAYGSGPWGYTTGTPFSTSDPIANTNDDVLYQWVRYGTFGYKFDLSNGLYDVTLHFSEVGWTAPNQRLFNVSIEGTQVLTNYDIFAEVGHDTATSKVFYSVNVQDGQLNIDFTTVVNAAIISAIQISPARPTKLVVTSVNGGNPVGAGVPFPVTIQAQNPTGTPTNATVATNVSLSVASGDGNALGGTISGTIPVGSNQVNLSGVTYSKHDYGVVLRAAATSGESLTPADSAPFNVSIGSPTKLGILFQPGNSTTSGAITGPPTVAVQDASGNTITTSTAAITIAIGTNPGGGTLSGTTVKNASAGVASFADLRIDQVGNGYTLTATSPSLTGATTTAFNIVSAGNVSGTVTKSAGGGAINGALVESLQSGVVKGTASTNSSGNYTITGLLPGNYDIRGTAGGFTPQTQTGISVSGGATATANFSLAVATPTAGIVYLYDELQRLKSVIDPVGEAATYAYDPVGNLLSITRNNATQTSVIDFNPNRAAVGSAVTIYGTGYSTTPSQNTVTFNGVAAAVTSSTLTQIQTTVPVGATDGPIAVTSPAGSATSSANFLVSGPLPSITSFSPTIGAVGTPVTISGANFNATPANNQVQFNRTAAGVSSSTSTSIQTSVPTVAQSGPISVTTPDGTGKSTQDFFVTPGGFTAGDIDFTGRLTIGGPPLVMSVSTVNKIAVAIFDGVVGQRISIKVSDSTFPDPGTTSATLKVLRPDGVQLGLLNWHQANGSFDENFLDTLRLPITGTYTITVDPVSTYTGQATITLYEVPAELQGTITPGGAAVPVATSVPGQNARLAFTANAGDKISGVFTAATLTCCFFNGNITITVITPDGTAVSSSNFQGGWGDGWMDTVTLPVSGTYTVLVDPKWTYFGTGTVRLYWVTDVTGTITPGGAAVPVATNTPGQNAKLTFTGSAGDKISGIFTSGTLQCCVFNGNVTISILKQDGTQVANSNFQGGWGDGFMDTVTLPENGTYTVFINPSGTTFGTGTVQLYSVTDVTGTITPGGAAVPVTIATPGQSARLTFSANAGDKISGIFTAGTLTCCFFNGNISVSILKQDGTPVANANFQGGWGNGFMDAVTLPENGTYTVLIDTVSTTTGNGTVQLYSVTDVTGPITPGGAAVPVTIDTPGQNARLTFSANAGDKISGSYTAGTLTCCFFNGSISIRILKTDGITVLASFSGGWGNGSLSTTTLPDPGTYTVLIDPVGSAVGDGSVQLFVVP